MTKELKYKPLFDEKQIAARIKQMGGEISRDLAGESLVVIGVLKGAIIFLADLVRAIDLPLSLEFIGVSSYSGTKSTGRVRLTYDLTADIKGLAG